METVASPMAPQDAVANGAPPSASLLGIDPVVIIDYLVSIVTIALGAKKEDLERDGNLLSQNLHADTVQRCTRFASDSQVAIYIQKEVVSTLDGPTDDPVDSGSPSYVYTITSEISSSPNIAAYLALLKRPQAIDPSLPLTSQIQIQTLPGAASLNTVVAEQGPSASPFEILHTIVHNALLPYFEASTRSSQTINGSRSRADIDAKTGIPVTKKRITELELSLLHLQQNVEIPDLSLPFHPIVQGALDEAAEKKVKPTTDLIPPHLLSDSKFMNNLQSTVNSWIKAIQAITKLTKDPVTRSATQEINFWLSMESALEGIEAQLRSEGVTLTLEILKHAKRFQATVSFSADTGLKEAVELVQKHNQLMRDFPLDELLSAESLPKVNDAIVQIFAHLNKKMRFSNYPIKRTLILVEAISADLKDVMHRLLPGSELVDEEYKKFKATMLTANGIFECWDTQLKEFTNVARETTRRRQEKFIPIKITPKHSELQARLKYVDTFRDNHEQLQRTIRLVLGTGRKSADNVNSDAVSNGNAPLVDDGDMDAIGEVEQAWEALKNVDLLDVSEEGTQRWVKAENTYNERTTRVENSIIATLRDRLATAKNANEMFRVFSQFNALFVRPKIRGAIAEYQNQLIENVKQAISGLQNRFIGQYGHSEAHTMAQLHDLPAVSGAIIWVRQIERQLDGYMKKVEDILGSDWTMHTEGQKLQAESEHFRKKLNTVAIYELWIKKVQKEQRSISGRLFNINKIRSADNALDLSVNFNAQIITLFKETRNLGWQNFNVPHSVHTMAKDAKRVYPFAVSLMESVRTFAQTTRQINDMSNVSILLSGYQKEVHSLIAKGVPLKWETFLDTWELHQNPRVVTGSLEPPAGSRQNAGSKHVAFVREFAVATSTLQAKTVALANTHAMIEKALKELATCPYEALEFQLRLNVIQEAVDQLNLQQYVNLGFWVEGMNRRIEATLRKRLQDAVDSWKKTFEDDKSGTETEAYRRKPLAPSGEPLKSNLPVIEQLFHEVTMQNQVIYLSPPLEFARASWFLQLHEWLGIVCNLPKIKASRYQISLTLSTAVADEARFSDLPSDCTDILERVYASVEKKLSIVGDYVDEWLQFQSLWDLQSEQVYEALGDELPRWLQLLQEIRKSRATFDNAEISRSFGRIVINYDQVQTRVNARYDQWQHEILMKFGSRLGGRMREVHAEIEKAREDLEKTQSLEGASTAQAVQFITIVQSCERNVKTWAPEVETFRQGQSTLLRNRYPLPNDWLDVQQVDSQWDALNELLVRKAKDAQDQKDALKAKIVAEDKVVRDDIGAISIEWDEEKPAKGDTKPEAALELLRDFKSRVSKQRERLEMVSKAMIALDLSAASESPLSNISMEIEDYEFVYKDLSVVWNGLRELEETSWTGVQPRKIRLALDGLIKKTKDMPTRLRQYAAFEYVQDVLRRLLKVHNILVDLKSEAMRDRHWVKIWKEVKPGQRFSPVSMTLKDVWDLKLESSGVIVKGIIAQAQGEMGLEEFLKQVKDTWTNYSLTLVPYQNKCRIISGWEDLFTKCSEHLTSLDQMKQSRYYPEFREEGSNWEEKLKRVNELFDVWFDMQRQWVYLEGVFTKTADIKHLLPVESARFQNINSEFMNVMKKVYKAPMVLDVMFIPNVQKSLERLTELLKKIQKALKEYLEKQRASFPRFYFLGDEDLLEMVGNSDKPMDIAKHFKKMFAGINNLVVNVKDDETIISGFSSREGEEVILKDEISLAQVPRINEWMSLLENGMKATLAELLAEAVDAYTPIFESRKIEHKSLNTFMERFPSQIVVLTTQVVWSTAVEKSLSEGGEGLSLLFDREVEILRLLAEIVLSDLKQNHRKNCEALITECVHQRDVIEKLMKDKATSHTHYRWLLQMRYVYTPSEPFLKRLRIKMANAELEYGFEYLGIPDRLVRTPLTDRCFLTLTQGLCQRLGGSPYGPAGTGKTESVKALGLQLGRFTLVFCCDDTFDFQSMERIFLGLCQVGAWGCFDEFNRLEERILSAVSQQIQDIQLGLKTEKDIKLGTHSCRVSPNSGIFITMNPGYAGRSNLPDNLKKLFRSVAMSKPDKELIAEVTLYSQGFKQAKELSKQTVPFFDRCSAELSKQSHYDFGLRALKSVLVSSGNLKRTHFSGPDDKPGAKQIVEAAIILQSIRQTIAPKLISTDVEIMKGIEAKCFPGVEYVEADLTELKKVIRQLAEAEGLVVTDDWMTKVIQLYQIQKIHHGVMMVGSSGSGKSKAWELLLRALAQVKGMKDEEQQESVHRVIDAKVMSKEALYGSLDPTTREWTDGLFTSILRKIVNNDRDEQSKRHWIVFDCDVDPEWVENLNSVLDDNKLLTLPNGERLNLPPNVRIMFEVETLKYATLATVSRCGMVWFSEDTVKTEMMVIYYLNCLKNAEIKDLDDELDGGKAREIQADVAMMLRTYLGDPNSNGFIYAALEKAKQCGGHIMEFSVARALTTLFSLMTKVVRDLIQYNARHHDFPLEREDIADYVEKKLLLAVVWSFSGDCPLKDRKDFGDEIVKLADFGSPRQLNDNDSLIDFDVLPESLPKAKWISWQTEVKASGDLAPDAIVKPDVVIPTTDTARHEEVLYSWLAQHKPILLCGPPGSGKTMTLFSALRKLENTEVVGINFSSATTPDLIIKTLEQHCEYKKTKNGTVLSPVETTTQTGRRLILFCDEINLPAPDKYGTQRAISFIRQLVEQNSFWRTSDKVEVKLDRIQFVGACNPPTDAGRSPLGARFLRHAPLIMVDYPGKISLVQIYGTFAKSVLKLMPSVSGYHEKLTEAMVQLYIESQKLFTPKQQPHYVYSPRELSRWMRGIYNAICRFNEANKTLSGQTLVRLWAHEAHRLFQDRLVTPQERQVAEAAARKIATEVFSGESINMEEALRGPILFSDFTTQHYGPVDQEELRQHMIARLPRFYEEVMDMTLVVHNDVLEHVLRIDRVLNQHQGHLILVGPSGSGKTTLCRFAAWRRNMKVFQLSVHRNYSGKEFDEDLRTVLKRSGCDGEKIAFIMDESNVLDSGFLERMNTLLANAEVPGLFEGDEHTALMNACKEVAQKENYNHDSPEELQKWFNNRIAKNLHVVFTMNPPEGDLSSRAATSPALFNRCVLNWMGDWSDQALHQVAEKMTKGLDLQEGAFEDHLSHRQAVVNALVYIHKSLERFNDKLHKQQGKKVNFLSPRHFLDFAGRFVKMHEEKKRDLVDQELILEKGLDKLEETFATVTKLEKKAEKEQIDLAREYEEVRQQTSKLADIISTQKKLVGPLKDAKEKLQAETATQIEKQKEAQKAVGDATEALDQKIKALEAGIKNKEQMSQISNVAKAAKDRPETHAGRATIATLYKLLHDGHLPADWEQVKAFTAKTSELEKDIKAFNKKIKDGQLSAPSSEMLREFLNTHKPYQQAHPKEPNKIITIDPVYQVTRALTLIRDWFKALVQVVEDKKKSGNLEQEAKTASEAARKSKADFEEKNAQVQETTDAIQRMGDEIQEKQKMNGQRQLVLDALNLKLKNATELTKNLGSERKRWNEAKASLNAQSRTLVGDVLTASAFLAYSGLYDEIFRKSMMDDWLQHLKNSGIQFKQPNPIAQYLSTAEQRLGWQNHGLPVDDLCTENAIILTHFDRFPLIIDPSGRVVEFLRKEEGQKLTVTSFTSKSFVTELEGALRFGNPILIQDAEDLDPIINPVLNKEIQGMGDRKLIQFNKKQFDFPPDFKMYLFTKNPSATFPPDICSRTTFVNFTVTQSSLRIQSLNDVVKFEREKFHEQRSTFIKRQGEWNVYLGRLRKELLEALNESRQEILEDVVLLERVKTNKSEADEITAKLADAQNSLAGIDKIINDYQIVAQSCGAIFGVLDQLHHLNHFYQFSLQSFLDIFHSVLKKIQGNEKAKEGQDDEYYRRRRDMIVKDLFVTTFQRTALGLLERDRIALAMLLVQASHYQMNKRLIDVILDESVVGENLRGDQDAADDKNVKDKVIKQILDFNVLDKEKLEQVDDEKWNEFLGNEQAEQHVPEVWNAKTEPNDQALLSLLLIKLVRVDRFVPAAEKFVALVFDEKRLFELPEDLGATHDQVPSKCPISLVSSPGFDASDKVDHLVESTNSTCTSIAMGSEESLKAANDAIQKAANTGDWVLVKNVHLTPDWLQSLEKNLEKYILKEGFRLFLSMESSPKIPVNFLRDSRVLMYERPAGVKANMLNSMSLLSTRKEGNPTEREKVYLLLSFLHAVVQERLRYAPDQGWRAFWEFNDADFECSVFIIDWWMKTSKECIGPENIPWEMIRYLVCAMYGGKIDDQGDFRVLETHVQKFLHVKSFDAGHQLVEGLKVPEGTSRDCFKKWIDELPKREPPTYLGLPSNANQVLSANLGRDVIGNVRKLRELLNGEE